MMKDIEVLRDVRDWITGLDETQKQAERQLHDLQESIEQEIHAIESIEEDVSETYIAQAEDIEHAYDLVVAMGYALHRVEHQVDMLIIANQDRKRAKGRNTRN